MLDCILSSPVNYNGETPTSGDIWNFSAVSCSSTATTSSSTSLITETLIASDTRSFVLQDKIDYGEILIISLLILGLVFGLVIFIRDFVKNRKLERL